LPTAAKSKQKMPLAKLCSSSNYFRDLAGRHNVLPALCDSIYFALRAILQMFKIFVWLLFLLLQKSSWLEGIHDKNHQDDGA
jgi:hypothetical protein